MLAETNPQEVMDLSPVAHLAAIDGKVPFINFFDGFRTSHEIQKIEKWDYEDLKEMCPMDKVEEFRAHALNPNKPAMRGSHENGDVFFQHREACNTVYDELPEVVEKYMKKVNEKLGTNYDLFNYYGAPDADRVIVAMGSVSGAVKETVDYLNAQGRKVDFKQTIIIMTSNAGAQAIMEPKRLGFMSDNDEKKDYERMKGGVMEEVRRIFKPEFLNRIDEIVMFEPLTHEDIGRIVDIQMNIVRKLLKENNIELDYTKKAKEWIARIGYDPLYGARPVKRTIQRYVVNDLSKRILAGDVNREHPIVIDADADGLTFKN